MDTTPSLSSECMVVPLGRQGKSLTYDLEKFILANRFTHHFLLRSASVSMLRSSWAFSYDNAFVMILKAFVWIDYKMSNCSFVKPPWNTWHARSRIDRMHATYYLHRSNLFTLLLVVIWEGTNSWQSVCMLLVYRRPNLVCYLYLTTTNLLPQLSQPCFCYV